MSNPPSSDTPSMSRDEAYAQVGRALSSLQQEEQPPPQPPSSTLSKEEEDSAVMVINGTTVKVRPLKEVVESMGGTWNVPATSTSAPCDSERLEKPDHVPLEEKQESSSPVGAVRVELKDLCTADAVSKRMERMAKLAAMPDDAIDYSEIPSMALHVNGDRPEATRPRQKPEALGVPPVHPCRNKR